MAAQIGADDLDFRATDPALLRDVSGLDPEPSGKHVLLGQIGVRSTQRLAIGDRGGTIIVALWPAELKPQAQYLYSSGRSAALIAAARSLRWSVVPSPHLGFRNSPASRRLYMAPELDAAEYAQRWEGPDGRRIGQHTSQELRRVLWPWLKERGYVADEDDDLLEQFLRHLGRRPAHLRPGLRLKGRWDRDAQRALDGRRELALAIRSDVDEILGAAGEPRLPAAYA
jgi:hypothetical protein